MKSMTGFATLQKKSKISEIEISLRSVNGRFLEPRFHMPRELMHLEADLRALLQKHFRRGTVDIFIHRKVMVGTAGAVEFNEELFKSYSKIHQSISKKLKIKSQPTPEFFMRLPELVTLETSPSLNASEEKILRSTFEEAVAKCFQERLREGKAIQIHLEKFSQDLQKLVNEMASLRVEANQEIAKRVDLKLKARVEGLDVDPQRLAQEVAILIEKSDINEELQRLTEHVKNLSKLIQSSDVEGKKLDFYIQELLREVNTIGSKSQVAKLTTVVIEAKSIIEKMREQVQNVE